MTPVVHVSPVVAIEFRPNFLAGVVVGAVGVMVISYGMRHPELFRAIEKGVHP